MSRSVSAAAIIALACSVTGCSSESSGGDYRQYFEVLKQAWNGRSADPTLQQVAAIPYATIGYRLGNGPQLILVLATDTGERRLWTSVARFAIETSNGRIVSSDGLEHNAKIAALNPFSAANMLQRSITTRWIADFPDRGRYAVAITCVSQRVRSETISILGQSQSSVRINERCNAASLQWDFQNVYWIAVDGSQILRSRQHIHPDLDAIEIETWRPVE